MACRINPQRVYISYLLSNTDNNVNSLFPLGLGMDIFCHRCVVPRVTIVFCADVRGTTYTLRSCFFVCGDRPSTVCFRVRRN